MSGVSCVDLKDDRRFNAVTKYLKSQGIEKFNVDLLEKSSSAAKGPAMYINSYLKNWEDIENEVEGELAFIEEEIIRETKIVTLPFTNKPNSKSLSKISVHPRVKVCIRSEQDELFIESPTTISKVYVHPDVKIETRDQEADIVVIPISPIREKVCLDGRTPVDFIQSPRRVVIVDDARISALNSVNSLTNLDFSMLKYPNPPLAVVDVIMCFAYIVDIENAKLAKQLQTGERWKKILISISSNIHLCTSKLYDLLISDQKDENLLNALSQQLDGIQRFEQIKKKSKLCVVICEVVNWYIKKWSGVNSTTICKVNQQTTVAVNNPTVNTVNQNTSVAIKNPIVNCVEIVESPKKIVIVDDARLAVLNSVEKMERKYFSDLRNLKNPRPVIVSAMMCLALMLDTNCEKNTKLDKKMSLLSREQRWWRLSQMAMKNEKQCVKKLYDLIISDQKD